MAQRKTDAELCAARFFVRIGQVGRSTEARDTETLPLFPLPLIMDAEGLLSPDARHLVSDDAAYIRRCDQLIRAVSLDVTA